MDNLTLRFKNARALIYARLCCKGCDYDGLQDLTGLADDQLDLVLKNMQDSREVCTVNRGGDVEYRLISLDKRVHSWELRRYNPDRVLAIDVETTGLDRSKDDVLQLAIVEYDEDVRVNSFYGSSKPDWPAAT